MRSLKFAVSIAFFVCVADACGRTELFASYPNDFDADCGNGVRDPEEACDDGNQAASDTCVPGCVRAACGDGILHANVEACDDGNADPFDGCLSNCAVPTCGNGIVEPGEVCDDGNANDTDNCPSRCLPAVCGDGFVRAGVEECDGGVFNANSPAFLLIQGSLIRPVTPVARPVPVAAFYDYWSASAHTGFEAPQTSRFFLYHETSSGQLGLVTIHGIDKKTSGQDQPDSSVTQSFVGLPIGTFVASEDDTPKEFQLSEPTKALGQWEFQNNSDGGAVSGFPYPGAFVIEVASSFVSGIETWQYVDGDGSPITLIKDEPAKLVALETSVPCRLNCTIPRCGDGILDGGEVCDDGNTTAGDACSVNCK
jgi:cysteine-rich repeat protein